MRHNLDQGDALDGQEIEEIPVEQPDALDAEAEGGNLLLSAGITMICCVVLLVGVGAVVLVVVLLTRRKKK